MMDVSQCCHVCTGGIALVLGTTLHKPAECIECDGCGTCRLWCPGIMCSLTLLCVHWSVFIDYTGLAQMGECSSRKFWHGRWTG